MVDDGGGLNHLLAGGAFAIDLAGEAVPVRLHDGAVFDPAGARLRDEVDGGR